MNIPKRASVHHRMRSSFCCAVSLGNCAAALKARSNRQVPDRTNFLIAKGLALLPALPLDRIDAETFGRSDAADAQSFARIGQVSSTIIDYDIGDGKGHTGRIVGNTALQYAPPRRHASSGTFKSLYGSSIMFVEDPQIVRTPPEFDPFRIPLELEAAFKAAAKTLGVGSDHLTV